jgi:hypothetical protein
MNRPLLFRFSLLGLVAVVLAAPLYVGVIGTLLWVVPLLLSTGLLVGGLVRQQQRGGSGAPSVLALRFGRYLAQGLPVAAERLLDRLSWLIGALNKALRTSLLPRWRQVLPVLGGLVALAYWLGYRLPGFDRHPTWPEFPGLDNPHLVVQLVPNFDARHGRRYQLPTPTRLDGFSFEDYYRTNLKNVRALGFQQTGNNFEWDLRFHGLAGGNNDYYPHKPAPSGFRPTGYQYLELTLASEKGYCKAEQYQTSNTLTTFYQYNYAATIRDTLFLRFKGLDYRIYVR